MEFFTRFLTTTEYLKVRSRINLEKVEKIRIVGHRGRKLIMIRYINDPDIPMNYTSFIRNKSSYINKYLKRYDYV